MKLQEKGVVADLHRWVKHFNKYHIEKEGSAKNTRDTYTRAIRYFLNYVELHSLKIKEMKNINRETFISFLYELEKEYGREYSPKTKKLYITILKTLFDHISISVSADENGEYYTYEKEFIGVAPKKANRREKIKHLKKWEQKEVVNYVEGKLKDTNSHYANIHSLGIKLMMFGGMRISEMLNLKLINFQKYDKDKNFIEVQLNETKSGIEQSVFIKKKDIKKELNYFRKKIKNTDFVFKGIGARGKMDRSNFAKTINNIYRKAGINRSGLHILRHTSAMNLQEKSHDVSIVKEHLRHASITTTMIYVSEQKDSLLKALRK